MTTVALPGRTWATLQIKALDEVSRTFEGIATTPSTDRVGDIVEPLGAQFTLPLSFLYQHDHDQPIGEITEAKATKAGIKVKGHVKTLDGPPSLKERLDVAWAEMKAGLVRGLSIGFRPIEWELIDEKDPWGGIRFLKWAWYELSAVTIPANADASITSIKSIDRTLAQAGKRRTGVSLVINPGGTGLHAVTKGSTTMPQTLQQQIASNEAKRAADVAAIEALISKSGEEQRTFTEEEQTQHDDLDLEIKRIDDHLRVLRAAEKRALSNSTPITPDADDATRSRTPPTNNASTPATGTVPFVSMGKSNVPKGRAFTRYAITLARAKGDSYKALEIAKSWKDSTPEVELAVKAAVAAGNTTDSAWAAPLAVAQNMASEFVELLYPMTIIGRLNGVRQVPFNVSMPRQTAGSTSSWVGEDNPKPVSRMSFETISLTRSKIATIVVLTEELVQDSSPAAEGIVQADMLASVAAYSDAQFIDPTVTASGQVRPASITNGLTTHNMTGTAVANVLTDMQTLMSGFVTANVPFTNATWIMHPRTALYLSMLLSPLGTYQFPGLSVGGGTFMGFPVITSTSVPIDTGADTYVILLDPSSILLADGGINVDISREASLQMDSAPTDAAASSVSLWQNNLVGLRCERRIAYRRRRDAAVQVLSAVSY